MNFLNKIFKKKLKYPPESLEGARKLNCISEEEFLRLKHQRALEELENYLKEKKKR